MQKLGIIEKLNEYEVPTKFGPKTKTNIVIEGTIYSKWGHKEDTSKDKKPLKEGDKVLMEYDVNNEYNNIKTIVLVLPDFKEDKTPQANLPIGQKVEKTMDSQIDREILKQIAAKMNNLDEKLKELEIKIRQVEVLARNGGQV